MGRLEKVNEIKERIKQLENLDYRFVRERLHRAEADFIHLYPKYMERLTDVYRWGENLCNYDYQFFPALERLKNDAILLATLACAAGADWSICREWYLLIAELCSFQKKEENLPFNQAEFLVYLALAGDFSREKMEFWPSLPQDSQATPDLILYSLMIGNPLTIDRRNLVFDDAIWLRFYDALSAGDTFGVKAACEDFAKYFWNTCEANEMPVYSPEEYPCFEPVYNAALAIALYREGMDISFEAEQYEKFYIGALCRT